MFNHKKKIFTIRSSNETKTSSLIYYCFIETIDQKNKTKQYICCLLYATGLSNRNLMETTYVI